MKLEVGKKKKSHHVLLRHSVWVVIFKILVAPWIFLYFLFKPRHFRLKKKGPLLLLSNHTAEFDVLLFDTMFDFPVFYVASEQLLNKGFGSALLKYFFNPIPKSKSIADISIVPRIKRVLNDGGNVAIFPEGNSTMNGTTSPMPPAIGKLIKLLNVPVVFLNSYGLYFSSPRWAYFRKFGPTGYKLTRVLEPSEFAAMSGDEINKIVVKELDVNAYKQTPIRKYRGFKRAEGLHKLIFTCPSCHQPFNMTSKGNYLTCGHCGFKGFYDEYGYLNSSLGRQDLVTLDYQVKHDYLEYIKSHPDTCVSSQTLIHNWVAGEKRRSKGFLHKIELNSSGISIIQKESTLHYGFGEIISYAIQVRRKFILYVHGNLSFFIRFPNSYSTYQFLITMEIFHNQHKIKQGETTYDLFNDSTGASNLGL